jgi:hypothetical protein
MTYFSNSYSAIKLLKLLKRRRRHRAVPTKNSIRNISQAVMEFGVPQF